MSAALQAAAAEEPESGFVIDVLVEDETWLRSVSGIESLVGRAAETALVRAKATAPAECA